MKNLLIDLDSKIPNLALCQISAWLKSRGEEVSLRVPNDPDRVWVSCVFTWNADWARSVEALWRATGAEVHVGGTGVDFVVEDGRLVKVADSSIPKEALAFPPDYSLYPEDDRAVGFAARGCNRGCEFCVVPMKEGRISGYWPIREWFQGRQKVLLLDNDLPLGPYHDAVLQEAQDLGVKISITQGYDLRCVARGEVSHEGLSLLAERKPWDLKFTERRLYVAWDYLGIERFVREGLEILLDYGWRPREIMVYILCGFNTTHEEDYYRYRVLWEEYGVYPFVMRYNRRLDDPWLNRFSRWVNRRLHKIVPLDQYTRKKDPGS